MLQTARDDPAATPGIEMLARLLPVLAGCVCFGYAEFAAAAQGTVIWKNQDCAYFILQTSKGYSLFEWVAGSALRDGDVIEGEVNAKGTQQLYNRTADLPLTGFMTARSRKRSEVEKDVPPQCR
jgi:hypothetical protein